MINKGNIYKNVFVLYYYVYIWIMLTYPCKNNHIIALHCHILLQNTDVDINCALQKYLSSTNAYKFKVRSKIHYNRAVLTEQIPPRQPIQTIQIQGLARNICVMVDDSKCKGKAVTHVQVCVKTIFNNQCIATLIFYPLNLTSIWNILNSWGVCVWNFMSIGVTIKRLSNKVIFSNHCVVTLTFDIFILKSIGHTLDSRGSVLGFISVCV